MQIWREIRFKFQRTLVVAELIVYVCTLIGSKWKLLFNLIEKKKFHSGRIKRFDSANEWESSRSFGRWLKVPSDQVNKASPQPNNSAEIQSN